MSLGETVSDISGTVIDATIQKIKELELQKEVLRSKKAGYFIINISVTVTTLV